MLRPTQNAVVVACDANRRVVTPATNGEALEFCTVLRRGGNMVAAAAAAAAKFPSRMCAALALHWLCSSLRSNFRLDATATYGPLHQILHSFKASVGAEQWADFVARFPPQITERLAQKYNL